MKMGTRLMAPAVIASMALVGCNTTPTQDGAVVGGALGAGAGAIIGNQSGKSGEGALIGAAAGALAGALVGDQVDERRQRRSGTYSQPAPAQTTTRPQEGHYETHIVTTPNGERYEERVWVPHN